jgi:uncharacterized repeat protein (TIGR03833 family)
LQRVCWINKRNLNTIPRENTAGRAGTKYTKENIKMEVPTRAQIKPGLRVRIVLKQDQPTGKLTEGIVKDILTSSPTHPHGIKVRLTSGAVGRVKEVVI